MDIRIYLTNLAKYNQGILYGKWLDLPFTSEQLLKGRKSEEYSEESFWQWCELSYVPDDVRGDKYRYIVVRSRIVEQKELFDTGEEDQEEKKTDSKSITKTLKTEISTSITDLMLIFCTDYQQALLWQGI